MHDGDTPYLSIFDLEKAFDSFEYATLLTHILQLGINGKCWRIIKNWHSDTSSVVRVNQQLSERFPISRGVIQALLYLPFYSL